MDAISTEALGAGGVIAALVVGIIAWKLFKLALKVVVFVAVAAAIAAVVALYLQGGRPTLPVELPGATPAVPAPPPPG